MMIAMPSRTTHGVLGVQDPTRRAPVQSRSRQRLEDILEVTARLVDEIGPDNVTTTVIADQLGISVGSIYAYFRDRAAIFDEIIARAIAEHDKLIVAAHDRMIDLPWIDASVAVIDTIVEIYRTDPGFVCLCFSRHLSTGMLEAMRLSDEVQAQVGLDRLTVRGLRLDTVSPMDTMRMYVGLIDKGLDLAFRLDPRGNESMIEETKQVVRQYVAPFINPLPSTDEC
jgi:AcrR family transcriptional regulator